MANTTDTFRDCAEGPKTSYEVSFIIKIHTIKVKVTLEQAKTPQRGSRGIALLFL
jgi:hypothetical protein